MIKLVELEKFVTTLLQPEEVKDYCPNGLQVEGKAEIKRLISGVTACQALIDQAVEQNADALLVHHGYFWQGENPCIRGMKRKRIATLIDHNISLLAYHLPLDIHPELGNNACLGRLLGIEKVLPGDVKCLVWQGELEKPMTAEQFQLHLAQQLDHQSTANVLHIAGEVDEIRSLAWCTGAAQSYIDQAAEMGVDAFLSGEVSEQTVHVARERGIHFFAAGHHATERYGVQAVGQHVAEALGIEHQFIDVANPV